MFNNTEIDEVYIKEADDIFVECRNNHKDIERFEWVLNEHGITTNHFYNIIDDKRIFTLAWEREEEKGRHRLMLSLHPERDKVISKPLIEWSNRIQKIVVPQLPIFLKDLVKKLKGESNV